MSLNDFLFYFKGLLGVKLILKSVSEKYSRLWLGGEEKRRIKKEKKFKNSVRTPRSSGGIRWGFSLKGHKKYFCVGLVHPHTNFFNSAEFE